MKKDETNLKYDSGSYKKNVNTKVQTSPKFQ